MSRLRWTRPAFIATALLSTLALVGCGGLDSSSSSATGGGKLGTLKVVLSEGHSLPFIAVAAGNQLGAWDGTGLTVETIAGESSTVGATMASGQADIGVQAGNKAAGDILSGVPAKIAAGILLPWDQYIVAATKSGATKPEDLKGRTIGISGFGSGGHFATLKMAESLGWSEKDYKIVQMGSLKNLLAGLQRGTIEAFIWSYAEALRAEDGGYGKVLTSVRDLVGPNAFEVISVSDAVAKERPEAVKAFFEGYFKTVKLLQADQAKAVEVMVRDWKSDERVAKAAVAKIVPLLSVDGRVPAENLDGLAAAVKFTVKGAGDPDIPSMYRYWQDIR